MSKRSKYFVFTTLLISLAVLVSYLALNRKILIAPQQFTQNQPQETIRLQKQAKQEFDMGKYTQALATFQQVLEKFQKTGQVQGEIATLNDIGQVYDSQGDYTQALKYYQQALAAAQKISDKNGEIEALANIGLVYYNQGNTDKTLELFQKALVMSQLDSNNWGTAKIFHRVGSLMEAKKQPNLAIAFYKKSANLIAEIRKNLQKSPKIGDIRGSYIQRFDNTPRRLANLLLKQNRNVEAHAAADLMKVQELEAYLHGVKSKNPTLQRLEYSPSEQKLVQKAIKDLQKMVELGKELNTLQQIPVEKRTPQQEKRRQEIETIQKVILQEFLMFSDRPEVVARLRELSNTTGGENLNPKLLRRLQDNLKQLQGNPVLLYPLVLENSLELLLVTPYTPPIRHSVPVKRWQLERTITEFRTALQNPAKDAKKPAQQLYKWLIQPIAPAIDSANSQTIIYAPDGKLRYIPLAALHNGKQWLVEKYRVNNITALSLTDLNKQPQSLKILAGAFSVGNYNIQVGTRTVKYGGLPFAEKEVKSLTDFFPGSEKLLNSEFTEKETTKRLSNYSVLHFATHAAFVTGNPEDSFVLFGDGEPANLNDLRLWNLNNTDLVVLSACETGVGGEFGNGIEILGFGYVMEEAGARAVIASLWQVSDEGTQALMNSFYATLQQQKFTKVAALQNAQLSLINNIIYEHPYYWAGFILIGNGL
ncbi:MAG: CHAT domain-containing protein [Calothrix sp. MO_167.B12]|nr:CHAT domain-containing protein [Calothrix sp. MO_167.B12]